MKNFCHKIRNHAINRTIFNINISFLCLFRDKEVTNIHRPTYLTSAVVTICLQEDRTLFILMQNIIFNIVSLILNKQLFQKYLTPYLKHQQILPSWCILQLTYIIMPPVWLFKSGWTENEVSTYHLMNILPSILNVKWYFFLPFKYFNDLTNLLQSIIFGGITLVVNTAIIGCILCLALFDKNIAFATILWKSSACDFPNELPLPFSNKLLPAGVISVSLLLNLCGKFWTIFYAE